MKLTRLNELIEHGQIQKGVWELSPDHELWYRREGRDEEVRFKGTLLAAEEDSLLFSITEKQNDQKISTQILKLTGKWQANSKNQLVFEVDKENGKKDALTFQSSWKMNDNHEIVYSYSAENLKTKSRKTAELIFRGFWDISEKNRLSYSLGKNSDSVFTFRGAFQTKSILAKKGQIRYQLGMEAYGRKLFRTLVLFGKWKVSRDLALSFEIEYKEGSRGIVFGAEYALNESAQIAVNLKTKSGEVAGFEVVLTKDFFKQNTQVFIRLSKMIQESKVEVGVQTKW